MQLIKALNSSLSDIAFQLAGKRITERQRKLISELRSYSCEIV